MTGDELRALRLSIGASQADMGRGIGVRGHYVHKLECGDRGITRKRERAIRKFVNTAKRRIAEVERELRKEVMRRVWDRPPARYYPRKPKPLLQRIFNP